MNENNNSSRDKKKVSTWSRITPSRSKQIGTSREGRYCDGSACIIGDECVLSNDG